MLISRRSASARALAAALMHARGGVLRLPRHDLRRSMTLADWLRPYVLEFCFTAYDLGGFGRMLSRRSLRRDGGSAISQTPTTEI